MCDFAEIILVKMEVDIALVFLHREVVVLVVSSLSVSDTQQKLVLEMSDAPFDDKLELVFTLSDWHGRSKLIEPVDTQVFICVGDDSLLLEQVFENFDFVIPKKQEIGLLDILVEKEFIQNIMESFDIY